MNVLVACHTLAALCLAPEIHFCQATKSGFKLVWLNQFETGLGAV